MSREIKFRAWDSLAKEYRSHQDPQTIQALVFLNGYNGRVVLEQYTGLKDKNGREIYEEDILRLITDGEVTFHVVKWCGEDGYPAFDLWPPIDVDSNGLSYCMNEPGQELEIIGNTHKNPELLND